MDTSNQVGGSNSRYIIADVEHFLRGPGKLSVHVIGPAALAVQEHILRSVDVLHHVRSGLPLLFGNLVGVMLDGDLAVGVLDLLLGHLPTVKMKG